jgi:hypothetical protein
MRLAVQLAAAACTSLAAAVAHGQAPNATWVPNFTPLGLFCFKDAQNVNVPASSQHTFPHSGGCGW